MRRWMGGERMRCRHISTSTKEHRRRYSTPATDQRTSDTPQDMPFLDGFPDRLIREGLPERLNRESVGRWDSPRICRPDGSRPRDLSTPIRHQIIPREIRSRDVGSPKSGPYRPFPPNTRFPEPTDEVESNKESGDGQNLTPAIQVDELHPIPGMVKNGNKIDQDLELRKALGKAVVPKPTFFPDAEVVPRHSSIHILGTGPIGKYIAHSLSGIPHAPPVTMLVHEPSLLNLWFDEGEAIRVLKHGRIVTRQGIHIEPTQKVRKPRRHGAQEPTQRKFSSPSNYMIENLIVTTDAHSTIPALTAISHRIGPTSTICFVQDGLGVVDEVNAKVFPDQHRRPNYALANLSHQIEPTARAFSILEKNPGAISFTALSRGAIETYRTGELQRPLIRRLDGDWAPFRLMTRTLSRSPELSTETVTRLEFQFRQLETIILRAVIGPLSVIFDCSNDKLLYNYNVSRSMKLLLQEIFQVLSAMPELIRAPKARRYLSVGHLEHIVVSAIKRSGRNTSPMLTAIRRGKKTGIEYYNGYIVNRGLELGIRCPYNELIMSLVKAKLAVDNREKELYIPFTQ
ncbi:ketopantoate reductase PanE/ApbA C terminal-domain-containing protein [Halenospora varia]|nr:ketopantoate reductase PanE/ApbA C terminal-domain-containing protein [Halenospora varia]